MIYRLTLPANVYRYLLSYGLFDSLKPLSHDRARFRYGHNLDHVMVTPVALAKCVRLADISRKSELRTDRSRHAGRRRFKMVCTAQYNFQGPNYIRHKGAHKVEIISGQGLLEML